MKHGKEVWLSRIFWAGGWFDVRVDVSLEREGENFHSILFFCVFFFMIYKRVFIMEGKGGGGGGGGGGKQIFFWPF